MGRAAMERIAMGKVYLVGAGPGDPELLTLRAARLLAQANIVLHDALVTREILAMISPAAKVIDIGKRCGRKLLTQAEINSLLISCAATAEVVIRLKGGDPCILGRAGEEIEALAEAGIAFEIVPGITSALAGAAAAGISLTDRRFASSVVFTTAHRGDGAEGVEWDKLVSSNSTLAVYMPGSDYRSLSEQMRNAGLAPNTPCMVISGAGRGGQQMLWTDIDRLASRDPLPSPALVIVGRCAGVAHEEEICRDWHATDTSTGFNRLAPELILKGTL
jgi:uroporphyrin-III C-methyltransferase